MIPFRQHHLLQLLEERDRKRLPLDAVINLYYRANKSLGSKDRAFISQTAYDLMRWQGLLDALSGDRGWASRFEAYEQVKDRLDDPVSAFPELPLHQRVSFPQELFSRIAAAYGEKQAVRLCLISNEQAPTFVRTNTLKITREELLERWKDLPVRKADRSPVGIVFEKRMNFFQLKEFREGLFEVQDEGSQLLASLVGAGPGDHFLDYCAGSGGKTLAVAPQMENKGQIYLHDIRTQALREARIRLRRAGVENGQIPKTLEKLKKKMDWVLADVPCSGTGTLRRNPDMKWRYSDEMLTRLVSEQRVIFEKALSYVKGGGRIVYGTCSLLQEENQLQTEHFLKTYPLELVDKPFQTLPEKGGMDGFYGVVFKKAVQ